MRLSQYCHYITVSPDIQLHHCSVSSLITLQWKLALSPPELKQLVFWIEVWQLRIQLRVTISKRPLMLADIVFLAIKNIGEWWPRCTPAPLLWHWSPQTQWFIGETSPTNYQSQLKQYSPTTHNYFPRDGWQIFLWELTKDLAEYNRWQLTRGTATTTIIRIISGNIFEEQGYCICGSGTIASLLCVCAMVDAGRGQCWSYCTAVVSEQCHCELIVSGTILMMILSPGHRKFIFNEHLLPGRS